MSRLPFAGFASSSWDLCACECEYHLLNGADVAAVAQIVTCSKHPRGAALAE